VQCTEADLGGLIDNEQHRNTRETLFVFAKLYAYDGYQVPDSIMN